MGQTSSMALNKRGYIATDDRLAHVGSGRLRRRRHRHGAATVIEAMARAARPRAA